MTAADNGRDGRPFVPGKPISPREHLKRAAAAPLASDEERYHLAAAQAEALDDIAQALTKIEMLLEARKAPEGRV